MVHTLELANTELKQDALQSALSDSAWGGWQDWFLSLLTLDPASPWEPLLTWIRSQTETMVNHFDEIWFG